MFEIIKKRNDKKVAFILFDNEEKGLLGSKAFNKKYMCVDISMNEQREYSVSAAINSFDNNGYCDIEGVKSVNFPNTASAVDIGNAVINAFGIIEEYKKSQKNTF